MNMEKRDDRDQGDPRELHSAVMENELNLAWSFCFAQESVG